jgi:hypothetical protein
MPTAEKLGAAMNAGGRPLLSCWGGSPVGAVGEVGDFLLLSLACAFCDIGDGSGGSKRGAMADHRLHRLRRWFGKSKSSFRMRLTASFEGLFAMIRIMKKVDWGNAPQWVSAICALTLAGLAIYGLFFSSTSQALIAYLQSELAIRNQHIAGLELHERELQQSISTALSDLKGLAVQKETLQRQVASLNAEQQRLSTKNAELGNTLSTTEFSLVKEKIGAELSSKTVSTIDVTLEHELEEQPEGVRGRTERPWDDYLDFIRKTADRLPERDRPVASAVVTNFAKQCQRLSSVVIQIPSLRPPKDADYAPYGWDISKHPTYIRLEAVIKQIVKVQKDIVDCFKSVTP